MKTILVIYSNQRVTDQARLRQLKYYAFNTDSEISEGDMLFSQSYDTRMQVVKVLDKAYKYYNNSTGDLSDNFTSTAQREVALLQLREDESNVVYAKKIALDI